MPVANLNGLPISYRQLGEGEDLVLIHGLAANAAFWNLTLVARLARHFRVTLYDLRGHGYSGSPAAGYAPGQMAQDLLALMDHLRIERAHLVAHSYGGLVAAHAALIDPSCAKSLVIADTRFHALQPVDALRQSADWDDLREILLRYEVLPPSSRPTGFDLGIGMLELFASDRWNGARRRFAAASDYLPFSGMGGSGRMARRFLDLLDRTTARDDFHRGCHALRADDLREISAPVRAIYGQRSVNLPTCERLAALLPNCNAAIVPGAGHYHPATRADLFGELVLQFLFRHSVTVSIAVPEIDDVSDQPSIDASHSEAPAPAVDEIESPIEPNELSAAATAESAPVDERTRIAV